jgi:hypothetical protein
MSENQSTDKFALTIEKFEGTVHDIMRKASITDGVFKFMPLIGTDTMSNNTMGNPELQKVVAGVEPDGKSIDVGKMIVQVKTPVIARVTTPMLATVQDHLDIKGKTPGNFGKQLAVSQDEVLFVQCVKSALYTHPTAPAGGTNKDVGSGGILPGGTAIDLAADGDELDYTKLTTAVYAIAQGLAELDIDQNDGKLYMAPAQYFTLLKNDALLNRDISKENGSYAHAAIDVASGMVLVMTNRLTQEEDTVAAPAKVDSVAALYDTGDGHYETSVTDADAVAVYATPDSIMVAESIPMTSDVYWEKRLLTWFIDMYTAFGAAPDRTDVNGIISKKAA